MADGEETGSSPEELIAYVEQLVRRPEPDTDRPAALGALGSAWLEVCVRDDDEAALETGLGYLAEAVASLAGHPDHPERGGWFYGLAQAHRMRAEVGDRTAEQTESIQWLRRLLGELAPDTADRDEIVAELAVSYAARYVDQWATDTPDLSALAQTLVVDVEALSLRPSADDLPRQILGMVAGLARLERYQHERRLDDLMLGLRLLDESVWWLPRGDDVIEHAAGLLAFAHYDLAERTGWDRGELLAAVATASRLLESTVDDDDREAPLVAAASAYFALWNKHRHRPDLDPAIDSWRAWADRSHEWFPAYGLALLLANRAEVDARLSDVDESSAILTRLLAVDDDRPAGELTNALATVMRVRFALTQDRETLEEALRLLDRVADLPADDDERIDWTVQTLETAYLAADYDGRQPQSAVPASAVGLGGLVEQGHALLARAEPADPDRRCQLAWALALGELTSTGAALGVPDLTRLTATLDLAATWADPPDGFAGDLEVVRETVRYADVVSGRGSRVDLRTDHLVRVVQSAGSLRQRHTAAAMMGLFEQARASESQSYQSQRSSGRRMTESGDSDLALMARLSQALGSVQRLGLAADPQEWRDLVAAVDATAPSLLVAQWIRPLAVSMVREFDGELPGPDPVLPPPPPGMDPQLRLLAEWTVLGARGLGVERRGDLREMRALAREFEQFGRRVEPDQLLARFGAAAGLGTAYLAIARRDRSDRDAAALAAQWSGEALALARGEHHPLWTQLAMIHAEAVRLDGRNHPLSLRLGMSALSAQARTVMLQNDTAEALTAAAVGRDNADQVLAWALTDGDPATAVAVLDISRGLTLAAASASRGVAERLDALGHPVLAAEWRATQGRGRDELTGLPLEAVPAGDDAGLPDALRAKVLAALDADPEQAVAASVTPAQIQDALAATGAQALVYLVPATTRHIGHAVIVPRVGPAVTCPLPGLSLESAQPLSRYLGSATRDLEPEHADEPSLPERLSAVGQAAGRSVWAELLPRLRRGDGPAHVVLVPMGELALVPWHVARTEGRYVVEDLMISYSPSARVFCTAARHPVAPAKAALIVGDPDGSLWFAGQEAQAIQRALHPYGRFLSQRGATRDAVLDWIAQAGPGPSLLHFACHGRVDTAQPDRAGLLLAGGWLSVRDLVEASRLAELAVDQVFLAACHTNAITGSYDEAFSLASVFLAAGAHTVFGSLWAVPDEATSLLMFMVHHYLTVEGRPPAHALHAAQHWMLDPRRRPPATMPANLAAYAGRPELAEPVAWAAFTHLGR